MIISLITILKYHEKRGLKIMICNNLIECPELKKQTQRQPLLFKFNSNKVADDTEEVDKSDNQSNNEGLNDASESNENTTISNVSSNLFRIIRIWNPLNCINVFLSFILFF